MHEAEPVLEPDLPICDPHHHLWDHPTSRYMIEELNADAGSGHRIESTVFVECNSFYRADGPRALAPVGETEMVNGVAAMSASGRYGEMRACVGIVGFADLSLGADVAPVLEAHIRAGGDRFRGVRHAGAWDADDAVRNAHTNPPKGLYGSAAFREGYARLADHGLSFEAWQFHPQLPEVTDLARAFPETVLVLDHVGGPLGIGPYEGRRAEVFESWKADLVELAKSPNVVVKLGGLGMAICGFGLHKRETPASSQELKPKSKAVITIGLHDTLQVDGTDTPLNGLIASLHKIKKDGELLNVVVNSDRGVEVQRLVDVMDVLKQGGFESIAIATRKP